MTISELITKLQELQAEHGDLEVFNSKEYWPSRVESVTWEDPTADSDDEHWAESRIEIR